MSKHGTYTARVASKGAVYWRLSCLKCLVIFRVPGFAVFAISADDVAKIAQDVFFFINHNRLAGYGW